MTTTESQQLIGTVRLLPVKGMRVEVKVVDVKESYGRATIMIEPVAGHGLAWVNLDSTKEAK